MCQPPLLVDVRWQIAEVMGTVKPHSTCLAWEFNCWVDTAQCQSSKLMSVSEVKHLCEYLCDYKLR